MVSCFLKDTLSDVFPLDRLLRYNLISAVLTILLSSVPITVCEASHSSQIDLSILSRIESGNNLDAINHKSKAVGLYQITPDAVSDFLLFAPDTKRFYASNLIADWYANERIPSLLRSFNIPVNKKNILIAYNAGIRTAIEHYRFNKKLPKETQDYLIKYADLEMGSNRTAFNENQIG